MRPGQHQQNRRGRGRNNNGNGNNNNNSNNARKGQNPLSRSFESNGPDVKVRGTPAHIAEKYLTLARDAQSSGDRVLEENYLQHAEHYNRIIMAYREQFQTPGEQQASMPRRMPGTDGFDLAEDMADDEQGDEGSDDFGSSPQPGTSAAPMHGQGPDAGGNGPFPQRIQHPPRQDNRPYEGRQEGRFERNGNNDRTNDQQQRGDRPYRRDGQQNNRFRDRNDRNDRNFRQSGNGYGNAQGDRDRAYEPRQDRGAGPDARPEGRPENRDQNRGDTRFENRPDQRPDLRPDQRPDQRPELRNDRGPRGDRPERIERSDRPERGPRPERAERHETPYETHGVTGIPPMPAPTSDLPAFIQPAVIPPAPVAPAAAAPQPSLPVDAAAVASVPAPAPRRRERLADQPAHEQPEFLRRPVRRTRAAAVPVPDVPPMPPVSTLVPDDDSSST